PGLVTPVFETPKPGSVPQVGAGLQGSWRGRCKAVASSLACLRVVPGTMPRRKRGRSFSFLGETGTVCGVGTASPPDSSSFLEGLGAHLGPVREDRALKAHYRPLRFGSSSIGRAQPPCIGDAQLEGTQRRAGP